MSKFLLKTGVDDKIYLETGLVSTPGSLGDLKVSGILGGSVLFSLDNDANHYFYDSDGDYTTLHFHATGYKLRLESHADGCYIESGTDWVSGSTASIQLAPIDKAFSKSIITDDARFGVLTTTPPAKLSVSSDVAVNADSVRMINETYDTTVLFRKASSDPTTDYNSYVARASRGTVSSPSSVTDNQWVGTILAGSYSSGWQVNASFEYNINGTPSGSTIPTELKLYTTNAGVTGRTAKLTIDRYPRVGVGTEYPGERLHINTGQGMTFHDGTNKMIGFNSYYLSGSGYVVLDTGYVSWFHLYMTNYLSLRISDASAAGGTVYGWGDPWCLMRLDDDGVVSFGSLDTPIADLNVVATTGAGTTDTQFKLRRNSNWGLIITEDYPSYVLYKIGNIYNGTTYENVMVFNQNRIGINTTNVPAPLTVHNQAHDTEIMRISSGNATYYLSILDDTIPGNVMYNFRPTRGDVPYNGLKIDSTGKVGIKHPLEIAPTDTLTVNGHALISTANDGYEGFYITTGNTGADGWQRIFFEENASGTYGFSIVYNGCATDTILNYPVNTFGISRHDGDATGVIVLSSQRANGFIGINTDDPQARLHVKGNNNILLFENTGTQGYLEFYGTGTGDGRKAYLGMTDSSYTNFRIAQEGDPPAYFKIQTTGYIFLRAPYVGILTTSPSVACDVNGSFVAGNIDYGRTGFGITISSLPSRSYSGPYSVSFNKTFPSAPSTVVVSFENNQIDGWLTLQVRYDLITTTGFQFYVLNSSSQTRTYSTFYVHWLAMSA